MTDTVNLTLTTQEFEYIAQLLVSQPYYKVATLIKSIDDQIAAAKNAGSVTKKTNPIQVLNEQHSS